MCVPQHTYHLTLKFVTIVKSDLCSFCSLGRVYKTSRSPLTSMSHNCCLQIYFLKITFLHLVFNPSLPYMNGKYFHQNNKKIFSLQDEVMRNEIIEKVPEATGGQQMNISIKTRF